MLQELHIQNFAIIDDLNLTFGPGLNILTGETGAGKSIIIDAINLLLGDRASTEWVRAGYDLATIEASFRVAIESDPEEMQDNLRTLLEAQGLDDGDNPEWVVLSREIRSNGRSVNRVNGRAISLQILSEVAALLVDIHGQGEHLNLLRPRTHIYLLDRYAGLTGLRRQVADQVRGLNRVRTELSRLKQDARTMAQRVDMLSYQTEEIFNAQLQAGEDIDLENERRRLSNAESLMHLAQAAQTLLNEGDGELPGALDLVGQALGHLDRLARIDPSMDETAQNGQGLLEQLADLGREIQDYAENLEFNPHRLVEVEERLLLIDTLKRKYGDTLAEILSFGAQAQKELDDLGNWEVRTADLERQEEALLRQIGQIAADLSQQRAVAGQRMARQVETELADLRMAKARFEARVVHNDQPDGAYLPDGRRVRFDSTGVDEVEFMISANPGEPLKPLARVASGGETARLMLALKSVLAYADETPTLIFDEIDQGIGGRVGAVVGQKLWRLTKHTDLNTPMHQVLCITHLPQLAAFGDQHFTVNKQVLPENGQERTHTVVTDLQAEARVEELMHMLGALTEAGRRSVQEMLMDVDAIKRRSHDSPIP